MASADKPISIEDLLKTRAAYQVVFGDKSGEKGQVLKDLERFCFANSSTFDTDTQLHALREGRREVYLRFKRFIELNEKDFFESYNLSYTQYQKEKELQKEFYKDNPEELTPTDEY